jgi:RNA polymerase sigma-70 factor (ECF subfamily)
MDDNDRVDDGATWMLALQAGDVDAFTRIVQEYQNLVHHLVFRFTGRREVVEDLSQEVFLRIYRARDRYRPDARFRTWLFTIVYNLCINFTKSRKLRRAPSLEAPIGGSDDGDLTLRNVVSDTRVQPPMNQLVDGEAAGRLRRALTELPPQQRAAMTLYQYRGLSLREIADVMDTTEKAVKSLLARGRENLREKVAPYFGFPAFDLVDSTEQMP